MGAAAIPALAISTVAGAGIGLAGQREQSRNARRSAASARTSAQTQLDQTSDQASLERLKLRRARRRAEGRLAVTAADAGVGTGETFDALLGDLDNEAAINERIIDVNLTNNRRALESGLRSTVQRLEASVPNAFLSTLTGALGGFNTGLSILTAGEAVSDLGEPGEAGSSFTSDLGVPERPEF